MTDERINELLQETLTAKPEEFLNQRIKNRIMAEGAGKENKMKKFKMKRTIVIAAAFCLLFGTVVVASTGIMYSVSHSVRGEYTDYSDLAKAEERAGISLKVPESFTNGYGFEEASVVESEDRGENDEVIDTYKQIMTAYTKSGEEKIAVYATPEQFFEVGEPEGADNITQIDGIDVFYFVTTYKSVPADYELTEEDIRRQEEEGLQLGIGAAEVSEKQVCNCMWIQDGVGYDMLCMDSVIPSETMFDMAGEIIGRK